MANLQDFVEVSAEAPSGLRWKSRDRSFFKSDRAWEVFHNRYSGKPCGTKTPDAAGYVSWKVEFQQRLFSVSTLVYMLARGPVPAGMVVDHKDGDALNNDPANLRLATRQQNAANARLAKNNTSGFKGVTRMGNKWVARIGEGGKHRLGSFDTPEEAHQAYAQAAQKLYGEFAKTA